MSTKKRIQIPSWHQGQCDTKFKVGPLTNLSHKKKTHLTAPSISIFSFSKTVSDLTTNGIHVAPLPLCLSLCIRVCIYMNEKWAFHSPQSQNPIQSPFLSLSLSLSLFLLSHFSLSLQWSPCLQSNTHLLKMVLFLFLFLSLSFLFSGNCLFGLVSGWFSEATEVVFRWSNSWIFNDCLIYLLLFCVWNLSLSFSLSLSAHSGIRYYVLPPTDHNHLILVFKHTMFLQYFLSDFMCTPPIIFLKYDNWYY